MVWQVRSAGETDTTKLYNIKEKIKKEYAQYLLPPKNAFGAENFNNMKGDRDAKIAEQNVAMNQQLDKEKKAYTKNLQNKYAQVLVDSWTKEGLPEWAEADIKKLKSKSEYKNMEEKQLLQAYALKLVESNWVDEDDRNNYKNKNKQATLTGASIVAALIRTWVIAVLLANKVIFSLDDFNKNTFENYSSEKSDIFEKLRCKTSDTGIKQVLDDIRESYANMQITTRDANCVSETDYIAIRNWIKTKYNLDDLKNDKNNPLTPEKIKNIASLAQKNKLTICNPDQIYNIDQNTLYFSAEFETKLKTFKSEYFPDTN